MKPLEEVRVLVVEDNPDTLFTVQKVLEARTDVKFLVEVATCLKDAEPILAKGSVDAVLLDLTLPDASGAEVINRILLINPKVGVVVLTGSTHLEEIAKQAGAGEFLKKPSNPKEISKSLQYAIIRKKQEEEKYQLDAAFADLEDVISRLIQFKTNLHKLTGSER